MALPPVAPILLQCDAVGQRRVDLLVRLRETGRRHLRHRLHRPRDVGLGQPGIQPRERGREAAGENGFLEARPLGVEVVGRDVGVAEGLKQLHRGILHEVQLVPAGRLRGHADSRSGVTRSSPVRRTDITHSLVRCSSSSNRLLAAILSSVAHRVCAISSCSSVGGKGMGVRPTIVVSRYFWPELCAGVQTALFLDMALKRCCDAFFQVRAYAYNRVEQMNDFMGHLPMSYPANTLSRSDPTTMKTPRVNPGYGEFAGHIRGTRVAIAPCWTLAAQACPSTCDSRHTCKDQ